MKKENPFLQTPRGSGSKESSYQKKRQHIPSKWSGLFAGMMAFVNVAEAQQRPQEGEYNIDSNVHQISMDELNQKWAASLEVIRSTSALRQDDAQRDLLYQGSVDIRTDRRGQALGRPQEDVRMADTRSLQSLSDQVIEVSTLKGYASRDRRTNEPIQSTDVYHMGMRVFQVSPDVSRNLVPTGRHVMEDSEADTADLAIALALEEVAEFGLPEGRNLEIYQASQGDSTDSLRVQTDIIHQYLAHVRVQKLEELPNGGFRAVVEADLLRESSREERPARVQAPQEAPPEPNRW